MKILVSGGGTGGHITPILAVAHKLKVVQPDVHVTYVGERGGKFADLTSGTKVFDEVHTIFAGKFRRYHGQSLLAKLVDVGTWLRNIRDIFYVIIGTLQAWRLLGRLRPDVIFLKGGYVGLPVGLAAALRNIPFVTHDSDALPGLSNRIVSRWASLHATGLPTEYYHYPKQHTRYVGVLVGDDYVPVTPEIQKQYRANLQLPEQATVLLVTGGSLGAQRLNQAIVQFATNLLDTHPDLYIIHQVGKGNASVYGNVSVANERLQVLEFMQGMFRYTGAADVIVTRAGANTLAELGVQGKACVVVPNPQLTGGHQLENAKYLLQHGAVLAVDETDFKQNTDELRKAISKLLEYPEMRQKLGKALQALTKRDAAHELAVLLLEVGKTPHQRTHLP